MQKNVDSLFFVCTNQLKSVHCLFASGINEGGHSSALFGACIAGTALRAVTEVEVEV
jgi:hypothetical protein